MLWVIELIEQIRSVRGDLRVPVGAKLPLIQVSLDEAGSRALERNRALVERLARIERFETAETPPKGAVVLPVQGGTFCLPVAEVIDLDAEKARLDKALDKLEKEMGGLMKKLSNEKFVANAPEQVVDEARARLDDLQSDTDTLKAAQARLAELG